MRVVMFYHSLRSDWNHGNAHFLRGVGTELKARGHDVVVYEAVDGWSATNLIADQGIDALDGFRDKYPFLDYRLYDPAAIDLDAALDQAGLVLVHEWTPHDLVARLGRHRASHGGYTLLFHDTHHRSVTQPDAMAEYDLRHYDAVLAYGAAVRDVYLRNGWASHVHVWHEAADTRVFRPLDRHTLDGDVVWIGNWGDEERTAELYEFLIGPVTSLGLKTRIHGVRYPSDACAALARLGIEYYGWLPNYDVPQVFARYRATVHVPRGPYVSALPGVPTIRVFEALACGIPLISAPWDDAEQLFSPGQDFLLAANGSEMRRHLRDVVHDPALARSLTTSGLATISARHTCTHRVDELLRIVDGLRAGARSQPRDPSLATTSVLQ